MGNSETMNESPELEQAYRALQLLSPNGRELMLTMLKQVANQEGISMDAQASGLDKPIDGLDLWESKLKQEGKSGRTIETYRSTLLRFLAHYPEPTRLEIQSWLAVQLKGRASSTVNSHRKALRSLFSFLHEEGLWPTDPTSRLSSVKVTYTSKDPPSMDQVSTLMTYRCRKVYHTQRFRLATLLLATTALRITEATSLRRDRVYIKRHEVRVIGKGSKERVVPLVPVAEEELRLYMAAHPNGSPYVFPGETKTGWWAISSYEKTLRRACQELGLPHFTPHTLRHFYATYLLQKGAKLEVVSRILGHAQFAPLNTPQLGPGQTQPEEPDEDEVEGEFREVSEDE
jgi:site-specific recombinase XerD